MDDGEYVRELLAILTRPLDPDEAVDHYGTGRDRIDRHDGFGRDVRVTSARVVSGEHAPMLELGFVLDLPDDPQLADVPDTGTLLLPIDAEWRRLSGYDDPADYAAHVALRVVMQVHRHVRMHQPSAPPRADVPRRAQQWQVLLDGLGGGGRVRQVAPGRLETSLDWDQDEPQVVTVLVTPEQWERVVVHHGVDLAPDDYFADLLGPLQEDERFIVFWDDDLARSTRAGLPPVRGTAVQRRMEAALAAAREENPEVTFGWYARTPGTPPQER
jgi:hypothetical protein